MDHVTTTPAPAPSPSLDDAEGPASAATLERRGRRWVLWSFLFCPCHLPVTLTLLATLAGSGAAGAALRHNRWAIAIVITAIWLAGTARGLLLVRRAERCRVGGGRCRA